MGLSLPPGRKGGAVSHRVKRVLCSSLFRAPKSLSALGYPAVMLWMGQGRTRGDPAPMLGVFAS